MSLASTVSNFTSPTEYLQYASQYYVGAGTFHEHYFSSQVPRGHDIRGQHWGDFFARWARYDTFWAHYENNVYRKVHRWSEKLKRTYGLYGYTRSIFSPAYRLVEFWATHILGGALDPEAGDGTERPSAIPIVTDNRAIRGALAKIWRDSNWQAAKEIWPRFGSAMGDGALMAVDDPVRETVTLRVIDPRTIRDVRRDAEGNVKAYIIEDRRPDPESRTVTGLPVYAIYTEVCEKVGSAIRYATYRNGLPYDWRQYREDETLEDQVGAEWTEEYDFVPLVVHPHRDMGLGWGWSELQPSLSKLHELDDLASKLDDWIRITVDAPWLFAGAVPPGSGTTTMPMPAGPGMPMGAPVACPPSNEMIVAGDEDDHPDERYRETARALYSPDPQTRAQPLVAPLDVASVSAHIQEILGSLREDHPELLADDVGPASSGEARKVAREKVEALVVQRRAGYDDALVRIQRMAFSIGAVKGYPGFEAFRPDSYDRGDLEHSIGPRPVFAVDSSQTAAEAQAQATTLKTLTDAGVPVDEAMRLAGYPPESVERVADAMDEEKGRQDALAQGYAGQFSDTNEGEGEGEDGGNLADMGNDNEPGSTAFDEGTTAADDGWNLTDEWAA